MRFWVLTGRKAKAGGNANRMERKLALWKMSGPVQVFVSTSFTEKASVNPQHVNSGALTKHCKLSWQCQVSHVKSGMFTGVESPFAFRETRLNQVFCSVNPQNPRLWLVVLLKAPPLLLLTQAITQNRLAIHLDRTQLSKNPKASEGLSKKIRVCSLHMVHINSTYRFRREGPSFKRFFQLHEVKCHWFLVDRLKFFEPVNHDHVQREAQFAVDDLAWSTPDFICGTPSQL